MKLLYFIEIPYMYVKPNASGVFYPTYAVLILKLLLLLISPKKKKIAIKVVS